MRKRTHRHKRRTNIMTTYLRYCSKCGTPIKSHDWYARIPENKILLCKIHLLELQKNYACKKRHGCTVEELCRKIQAFYLQGFSCREIGEKIGLATSTVNYHLTKKGGRLTEFFGKNESAADYNQKFFGAVNGEVLKEWLKK